MKLTHPWWQGKQTSKPDKHEPAQHNSKTKMGTEISLKNLPAMMRLSKTKTKRLILF
jgi:hypothetical protein